VKSSRVGTKNTCEGRSITQADFEGKNAARTIIVDMPMPGMPMLPAKPANGNGDES
jgi:hypothetical protein